MFEAVEKAWINGIACGALTLPLFGSGAVVPAPMTNSTMPLWLYAFLLGGASSFVGDIAHLAMKENVAISEKWNNRTTLLVSAGVNAVLFYGGMCFLSPGVARDVGIASTLAIAGGGELIGSALYSYGKENLYL